MSLRSTLFLLSLPSTEVINEHYLHPKPPLWGSMANNGERKVLSMACGCNHLLVVTKGHAVYSSGSNTFGQLGHGDKVDRATLTEINSLQEESIVEVSAGNSFSYFVDQTRREISACGLGDSGQLGIVDIPIPRQYSVTCPYKVSLIYNPNQGTDDLQTIKKLQPEVKVISCGDNHVLVVTAEGDAYSWGCGVFGKCGHGISEGVIARPKKLESNWINKFLYCSAGDQLSLAVAMVDEECLHITKQLVYVLDHNLLSIVGRVESFYPHYW